MVYLWNKLICIFLTIQILTLFCQML